MNHMNEIRVLHISKVWEKKESKEKVTWTPNYMGIGLNTIPPHVEPRFLSNLSLYVCAHSSRLVFLLLFPYAIVN